MKTLYDRVGNEPGAPFPAYVWPGGYAIVYVTDDGSALCGDCVNGGNGSEASTDPDDAGTGWLVEGAFSCAETDSCHYCDNCNAQMAGYCDGDEHSEHCDNFIPVEDAS